jgi:hypothetical protein
VSAPLAKLGASSALLTLAACGAGSLKQTGVPRALAGHLDANAVLASAICGYSVQSLDVRDPRTHEPTVDAWQGMSGPAEARVVGVPVSSPGVPAGPTCGAHLRFGYETAESASGPGRYGGPGASLVFIHGPIEVVSRTVPPPAGVPVDRAYGAPRFAVLLALKPRWQGHTLYGTFTRAPGEAQESMVADYELEIPQEVNGPAVQLNARCGNDWATWRGASGRRDLDLELYATDGRLLGRMHPDDAGYAEIRNKAADVALEVKWNGGAYDGYMLATPGRYRVHVLADCDYVLDVQTRDPLKDSDRNERDRNH